MFTFLMRYCVFPYFYEKMFFQEQCGETGTICVLRKY